MTQDEFIKKSIEIHNNKYDYSLVDYTTRNNLVEIICPTHGKFEQVAGNHLQGKGCKYCAKNVKITKETFIEKAIQLHGNKYDYNNIIFIDRVKKIDIFCNNCEKYFSQSPRGHLMLQGCPRCAGNYVKTHKEWLEIFYKKHKGFYDYSLEFDISNKISKKEKIRIICPIHGEFEQSASKHKNHGCYECGVFSRNLKREKDKYLNKLTYLYYILINNKYYKLGLTRTNLTERFKNENIEIKKINIWEFKNGLYAFELEQKILSATIEHRILIEDSPISGGWTEIRMVNIIDLINKELENYKKEYKCI